MKFIIDLSADELEKLAAIANKKNESMHKTGADVIREFISRPTQAAPDAATPRRRMVACPNCETMFGVELSPAAPQVS